ncbi:MAG: hypothetical protein FWD71_16815 [Oscillospiraceae bacterium]|nr:hypothetical protein [Oscillospiraceae bacterium]
MAAPLSEKQKLEVMQMFDSYCKTVICNAIRNFLKEKRERAERETLMSDIPEDMYPAYVIDTYFTQDILFKVLGEDVIVEDCYGVAESIKRMKKSEREIILLYYVIGMTDSSIGKKMNLSHQEVNRKRHEAEEKLKGMVKREIGKNEKS